MNDKLTAKILSVLPAQKVTNIELIQPLWSHYGELIRVHLEGCSYSSVIVKHIRFPEQNLHPKGWHSQLSHSRKLFSYQVEVNWYQHFSQLCADNCAVPQCLYVEQSASGVLLILQDLATCGFSALVKTPNETSIKACLRWLGHFHGQFMHHSADGLWPIGTYWHLNTRPDELVALEDKALKNAAQQLDNKLNQCQFQTLVHGDAKLANFCFSDDHQQAAAVDFQYIGQGCGMKDIAYFLSSVLPFELTYQQLELQVEQYLNYYFDQLKLGVNQYHPEINADELVKSWRSLYEIAWADFHRFLKGWSPEHHKINAYSETLTVKALAILN
ncbi:phosphotransferase [Shewanella gaetbuli]